MTPTVPSQLETEPPATTQSPSALHPSSAFRARVLSPSLPESHRTIPFSSGASWIRKVLAFAGPGYLVAVGYMDPGNWATDLGGGSKFGYTLLSVILISNLMAMFLQGLSAKLGIASGRDLAQACREHYSPRTGFFLWVVCEIAIAACDLAEVLGSAVALKLLFGLPLLAGVLITAMDVLIVLALQGRGFRLIESFVVTPEKLKAMGLTRSDGAPAVGMWVGYKLDETEWAAFKRGERPMFSIEGEAEHA